VSPEKLPSASRRQGEFKTGRRRRKEAGFGAKNNFRLVTSAHGLCDDLIELTTRPADAEGTAANLTLHYKSGTRNQVL